MIDQVLTMFVSAVVLYGYQFFFQSKKYDVPVRKHIEAKLDGEESRNRHIQVKENQEQICAILR